MEGGSILEQWNDGHYMEEQQLVAALAIGGK